MQMFKERAWATDIVWASDIGRKDFKIYRSFALIRKVDYRVSLTSIRIAYAWHHRKFRVKK